MKDSTIYKLVQLAHNVHHNVTGPILTLSPQEVQDIEDWSVEYNARQQREMDNVAIKLAKLSGQIQGGMLTWGDVQNQLLNINLDIEDWKAAQ